MSDSLFFNRLRPYATDQQGVSSSVINLTTAKVDNTANYPDFKAAGVIIAVSGNSIYYTLDGTTPSSANGITLNPGDILPLAGYQKVKNFKAIRVSADAVIDVQYFKN